MKTRENAVNAASDAAPHYRYDGVDEDGQHWLERVEIDDDGSEIYTEDYVPIRLHARKAEATMNAMPDRWMKDAAERIARLVFGCPRNDMSCNPDCEYYGECRDGVDAYAVIIALHYEGRSDAT